MCHIIHDGFGCMAHEVYLYEHNSICSRPRHPGADTQHWQVACRGGALSACVGSWDGHGQGPMAMDAGHNTPYIVY